MKIECANPQAVAKRAFFLAWKACGGPIGMGVFQDDPSADEDRVWGNVNTAGDYAYRAQNLKPNQAYGDYVFGRMMKLSIKYDGTHVEVSDSTPRSDYQSWCCQYTTYQSLIEAAVHSLVS